MSGWILGSGAVEKLALVRVAFQENRLRQVNQDSKFDLSKFHPIMSNSENAKTIQKSDFEFLSRSSTLLCLEKSYLEQLSRIYTTPENLKILSPRDPNYAIHIDILKTAPNSFAEMNQAIALIRQSCRWLGSMLDEIVCEIIPIKNAKGETRFYGAFSDYDVVGTIFTSLSTGDTPIVDLAVSIVHELGHQALMLYQAGQPPIADEEFQKLVYSGVRKTLRPSMGAFHAVVALSYMNEFYKNLAQSNLITKTSELDSINQKSKENINNLVIGLQAIQPVKLTEVGKRIIEDISETV